MGSLKTHFTSCFLFLLFMSPIEASVPDIVKSYAKNESIVFDHEIYVDGEQYIVYSFFWNNTHTPWTRNDYKFTIIYDPSREDVVTDINIISRCMLVEAFFLERFGDNWISIDNIWNTSSQSFLKIGEETRNNLAIASVLLATSDFYRATFLKDSISALNLARLIIERAIWLSDRRIVAGPRLRPLIENVDTNSEFTVEFLNNMDELVSISQDVISIVEIGQAMSSLHSMALSSEIVSRNEITSSFLNVIQDISNFPQKGVDIIKTVDLRRSMYFGILSNMSLQASNSANSFAQNRYEYNDVVNLLAATFYVPSLSQEIWEFVRDGLLEAQQLTGISWMVNNSVVPDVESQIKSWSEIENTSSDELRQTFNHRDILVAVYLNRVLNNSSRINSWSRLQITSIEDYSSNNLKVTISNMGGSTAKEIAFYGPDGSVISLGVTIGPTERVSFTLPRKEGVIRATFMDRSVYRVELLNILLPNVSFDKPSYVPGDIVNLQARLQDGSGDLVSDANVSYLVKNSGSIVVSSGLLINQGNGQYSASFTLPLASSVYSITVQAAYKGQSISASREITAGRSLSLTAEPSVIQSRTGERTRVTASFRDAVGNPVVDRIISFSTSADGRWTDVSGYSTTSVRTDINGNAIIFFEPQTIESAVSIKLTASTQAGASASKDITAIFSSSNINFDVRSTKVERSNDNTLYSFDIVTTTAGGRFDGRMSLSINSGEVRAKMGDTSSWNFGPWGTAVTADTKDGKAEVQVRRTTPDDVLLTISMGNLTQTAKVHGHYDEIEELNPYSTFPDYISYSNSQRTLDWSVGGKFLSVIIEQRTLKIWNLTNSTYSQYNASGGSISAVSFSPDGNNLVILNDGFLKIINPETGAVQKQGAERSGDGVVSWSPLGDKIAISGLGSRGITIWTPDLSLIRSVDASMSIRDISWSPRGTYLAAGLDGQSQTKIWRTSNWSEVSTPTLSTGGKTSSSLAWNPDENKIAIAWMDPLVTIHNVTDGAQQISLPHQSTVFSVDWSRDGRYLVTGSDRGIVFDINNSYTSYIPYFSFAVSGIKTLKFLNDNKRLAAGTSGSVMLYAPFDNSPPVITVQSPASGSVVPYTISEIVVQGLVTDETAISETSIWLNGTSLGAPARDEAGRFSRTISGLLVGRNEIAIQASDPKRLESRKTINVERLDNIDVAMQEIRISSELPRAGESVRIINSLTNLGNTISNNINILTVLEGVGLRWIFSKTTSSLGDIDFIWSTLGLPVGTYTITSTVSYPNDSNLSNNILVKTFELLAPLSLNIQGSLNKNEYAEGEGATLSVSVGDSNQRVSDAIVILNIMSGSSAIQSVLFTNLNSERSYISNFNVPIVPGNYTISIVASKTGYQQGIILLPLVVRDTTLPSVIVYEPDGGEKLKSGEEYEIRWNAVDNVSINRIDILYSINSGGSWQSIANNLQTNSGRYLWDRTPEPSPSVLVKVVAYDLSGNVGEDTSDNSFAIDLRTSINSPPIIANPISDQRLVIGVGVFIRDLNVARVFTDSDSLRYTTLSSNISIASSNISGSILTVLPLSVGNATITVTSDDEKGGTAYIEFNVEIISKPTLSISSTTGRSGQAISTILGIAEAAGSSGAFKIRYSATQLTLNLVQETELARRLFPVFHLNNAPGEITATFLNASQDASDVSGTHNGPLVEFNFTIATGIPSGTIISLQLNDVEITDQNGVALPVTLQNGQIIVSPSVTLGDVNNDGRITQVDALFVLQVFLKKRTFTLEQEQAADVNGDGRISQVDALFILQAFLGKRKL